MAISDKYGTEIKRRLESHQAHGMWGDSKYIYGKNHNYSLKFESDPGFFYSLKKFPKNRPEGIIVKR